MSMGTGLVKYDGGDFALAMQVGQAAADAGQYGTKNAAELALRVQYGIELGLGPAQSLNAIHVVQGKPTLTAGTIASKIKGSGRYDYRVTAHTDQACTVVIYERGVEVGTSTFTMDDAQRAGLLSNKQWKSYPKNMLFARAITNAARWYAADVFGGAVYTPDEMGADIDGETGEVIAHQPTRPALEAGTGEAPADEYVKAVWAELLAAWPGTATTLADALRAEGITGRAMLADPDHLAAAREIVAAANHVTGTTSTDPDDHNPDGDIEVHPDQESML